MASGSFPFILYGDGPRYDEGLLGDDERQQAEDEIVRVREQLTCALFCTQTREGTTAACGITFSASTMRFPSWLDLMLAI